MGESLSEEVLAMFIPRCPVCLSQAQLLHGKEGHPRRVSAQCMADRACGFCVRSDHPVLEMAACVVIEAWNRAHPVGACAERIYRKT